VVIPSRQAETEAVLAAAQPYFEMPVGSLERLLDEALDEVESRGLPHRAVTDRSSWRTVRNRIVKGISKQESAAPVTATAVASEAVTWAHDVGLDLTDYNTPIAISVAIVVTSSGDQTNSGNDADAGNDGQNGQ
jgi:hypothetical protein